MTEDVLVTHALSKHYGRAKAVDCVDLTIRRGDIYGLVGRNGAGKTTIIRMAAGQTVPTSGEIALFGETTPAGLNRARARAGAMVEVPSFYPYLSAHDNLEYYRLQRGIPGKEVVDEALTYVGLADVGQKKFKTFSLGMKQRLGLALALMNHPDLLLLDEPVSGLDPKASADMYRTIYRLNRQYGITILMISHDLDLTKRYATHILRVGVPSIHAVKTGGEL